MAKKFKLAFVPIFLAVLTGLAIFINNNLAESSSASLVTITPGYYKVAQVVDGDTIVVDMDGTSEKIRMIGVDTPETKDPDEPVQCYGPEASKFATSTLQGKTVRLEADPTNDNRDRYGRLLRYVYTQDGELFEEMLIKQGYAFAYLSFTFQKNTEFAELQNQAQTSKIGLWAVCQPTQSSSGKWTSNDL